MSLFFDMVVPITSTITATGVLYIAREAHEARKQVKINRERSTRNEERSRQNKERSMLNRTALAQEGIAPADPTEQNEEKHG